MIYIDNPKNQVVLLSPVLTTEYNKNTPAMLQGHDYPLVPKDPRLWSEHCSAGCYAKMFKERKSIICEMVAMLSGLEDRRIREA